MTVGKDMDRFACPVCGASFDSPETLEDHGTHEHGETFMPAVKEAIEHPARDTRPCPECGTPVVAAMTSCPECGATVGPVADDELHKIQRM